RQFPQTHSSCSGNVRYQRFRTFPGSLCRPILAAQFASSRKLTPPVPETYAISASARFLVVYAARYWQP
ncbi:hypothetical protein, partial [Salmonella enterica]|uniref:hypothetical protein n=1 Tax=Salmonella enterica TaxID=28901 RepID=UPI002EAE14E5|nr:hypothetical protein [Salmonella enterica subsp. enterica serovar Paratyphi A]